jgi:hypothetical protein
MHTNGWRREAVVPFLAVICACTASFAQTAPQIAVDLAQPTGDVAGLGHNLPYYDVGAGLWDSTTGAIKSTALDPVRYAGTLAGTCGRTFIRFPGGNENEDTSWRRGIDAAGISERR